MKQLIVIFCILGTGNMSFAQWTSGSGITHTSDNVGIGTSSPNTRLDVNGNVFISSSDGYMLFGTNPAVHPYIQVNSAANGIGIGVNNASRLNITYNGNVGIGTGTPDNNQSWDRVLDVHGANHAKFLVTTDGGVKTGVFSHPGYNGKIGTESNHDLTLMAGYWNDVMTLTTLGNVGIGTTSPSERLSVNGKIRAREIKVETSGWPDFVFEPDYKLPDLKETEHFIKKHKHLPEVPSAREVLENGVDLGEMNAKLLQKIEELTLHLIEQEKIILRERTINSEQQSEMKKLVERLQSLETHVKAAKL